MSPVMTCATTESWRTLERRYESHYSFRVMARVDPMVPERMLYSGETCVHVVLAKGELLVLYLRGHAPLEIDARTLKYTSIPAGDQMHTVIVRTCMQYGRRFAERL